MRIERRQKDDDEDSSRSITKPTKRFTGQQCGLLKNEADAEDVVQDTFVALIESYESIKDKTKVTSWLKKTAANKCLDRIKLAKTDNMDNEFFDSVEAIPEDFLPDSIIESEESRRIVMDILNHIAV